ncbi:MAG: sulfite exporter TauE/SafE family protein [Hydrogenophaga sp.]|uniref:Probable membrane transporter protein n=1 Tax=Hydrogenophaga crocea TaxID=2716225 RepID=A0A6G8IJQ2_9BURK|nr:MULTISPECIES: sulfite exporter TauE/SafE family protein [Hydrogenophaga]MBL0945093.1 sulfite exporter TauE/SafE family protein [Hydrogenophaga sp.]QIM53381.1 sulfite exporter TauE/SafE family protein [Hydrogenophaga crocea]
MDWLTTDLVQGVSGAHYLAAGLLVVVGACLQGVSGLGFAMFSAPLAAMWFPELVPGPLLVLSCPLALMGGLRDREAIQWPLAGVAVVGRLGGTVLAAACLVMLSVQTLSLLFALLILTGVSLSLTGWRVMPTRRNMAVAGLASGMMGTITSAGAPPFAIAMQNMGAAQLRGTFGAIFFIGSAVSIAVLTVVGRMGAHEYLLSALLMPWMFLGFFASNPIKRHVPAPLVRKLLLAMAAIGALVVLFRTLTA